jgi:hypothetical protein
MLFELIFTEKADSQLDSLAIYRDKKIVLRAVQKTLALMETHLRHPSLHTHEYRDFDGEKLFESYAQNSTPGAFRIFWHYGPQKGQITVVAIVPHP